MLSRCNAASAITNSIFPSSSSSSSPSSSSPEGNPVVRAALSLIFLLRNFSSLSSSAARPPTASFHPRQAVKMRGAPAARKPSTGARTWGAGARALVFSSPESLSDWLRHRLPSDSFASWGVKPGTKTVHNLWLEMSLGETSLLLQGEEGLDGSGASVDLSSQQQLQEPQEQEEGLSLELSLLRTVHVATVKIRNATGAMLVETHQLLSDGTIRSRRRPLSEKMKPGESIEEAASRAVREELGGEAKVRIIPETYETRVEEKASSSYPGLPAQYVLHSVDAEVEGVPQEGEFSTEEVGECSEVSSEVFQKAVFVQRHFWKWVHDGMDGDGESTLPLR